MKFYCLIAICIMAGGSACPQASPDVIKKRVDSLIDDAIAKQLFTGTVLLAKDGRVFYDRTYGCADWDHQIKLTEKTLYNIASIGKKMTEEIIDQLVNEKKLGYQDKLSLYSDAFEKEVADKITIQQLLEMSAGFGDYTQRPEYAAVSCDEYSIKRLIEIIKKEKLLFEPGTRKEYSNSGYVVLGAVIEKVTGLSYEDNVRKRIIEPLGLNSFCYTVVQKKQQSSRAFGTKINFAGVKTSIDDVCGSSAAGGMYMDRQDLFTLGESFRTAAVPSHKKPMYGLFAGGTSLWNCVMGYNDIGYTMIVMANTGEIADQVSSRVAGIIRGREIAPLEFGLERLIYKDLKEKGPDFIQEHTGEYAKLGDFPLDVRFLNYFGIQFLNGNEVDMAIQMFTINTKLFPNHPNSWLRLGEGYAAKGNKEEAKRLFKKVLEMQPDNEKAKKELESL